MAERMFDRRLILDVVCTEIIEQQADVLSERFMRSVGESIRLIFRPDHGMEVEPDGSVSLTYQYDET